MPTHDKYTARPLPISSHLLRSHEDVHDVVLEFGQSRLDTVVKEGLDLAVDDGVLVVGHIREVNGVIVLGDSSQLILFTDTKEGRNYR